jgi:hypothetical protein
MSNSECLRCRRRIAPSSVLAAVLLVLLSTLAVLVDSQTEMINFCGVKPCIEPVRMSCQEMIVKYRFQGSCCSMVDIPQTGGCRITVSYGNCFWYPWCDTCEAEEAIVSRCNNIFETSANERPCPVGEYDPLEIQKSVNFTQPSCAPSMAPSEPPTGDGSSASTTRSLLLSATSVTTTGAVAVLVAVVAAAFVAA